MVRRVSGISSVILIAGKAAGLMEISLLAALSPLLIYWGLFIGGAIAYFPFWYHERRTRNGGPKDNDSEDGGNSK